MDLKPDLITVHLLSYLKQTICFPGQNPGTQQEISPYHYILALYGILGFRLIIMPFLTISYINFPVQQSLLLMTLLFSSTPAVPAFVPQLFCITSLLRVTFPHTLCFPTEGGLGLANARTLWHQGRKLVQQ